MNYFGASTRQTLNFLATIELIVNLDALLNLLIEQVFQGQIGKFPMISKRLRKGHHMATI